MNAAIIVLLGLAAVANAGNLLGGISSYGIISPISSVSYSSHQIHPAPIALAHAPIISHSIASPLAISHGIAAPYGISHGIASPLISTYGIGHGIGHGIIGSRIIGSRIIGSPIIGHGIGSRLLIK